ncbi:MAG TPA: ABC transporter ATP-binding protein, partial [Clostridiales bacterium]|nr:ABC transporter ATP-binding protein [Clostridiales bacterium]
MKRNPPQNKKSVILRLFKSILEFYPVIFPAAILCIIFNSIISSIPAIFMQNVIALVEQNWKAGDWNAVGGNILRLVAILAVFYVLSIASSVAYNQMMVVITQGSLKKFRVKMFNRMQTLPIKYVDTNNHGDIMSYYTNDIDTLRQMISQSFPQLLVSSITVFSVFCIMMYYCVWLTIVVVIGVTLMLTIIKKVGGGSAKFFIKQQKALGHLEGFVEEMMNGQKVIKVFCHEEESKADFDVINESLFRDARAANQYANILGPILNNIGNVLYVIVAIAGGALLVTRVPNFSLSGLPMGISIVVPFLNMTKQFAGNINQVSHQINAVVMGIAGAQRIFDLLDEEPEQDSGYVTLVNVREENGKLVECKER